MGLYFRRHQALCRASQMRMKALAAYLFILPTPASARVRKRGAAQDATKFNSAELSRFTPAIQPIMYRCHKLSLQWIELAITSVSSLLGNQLIASGSQRARDHGQRAVVTRGSNLVCHSCLPSPYIELTLFL